jgi:fructokinase
MADVADSAGGRVISAIAVIGEAVADAIVQEDDGGGELRLRVLPGGGPVNTAVALSRLGTPTHYLGRLARGPIGQLLRRHLSDSRVDISATVRADQLPTLAITSVGPDGHAAYDFYLTGTADWQWTTDELADWRPEGVVALHAASLALTQQPGAAVIEDLLVRLRRRTTVSIDPNVRSNVVPAQFYREALPRWAGLADILRLSDDDLEVAMPRVPVEAACAQFHDAGTPLVVVTRGSDGAYASLWGEAVTVPALDVDVVDTVGAGDSFTAGLLHWLYAMGALGGRLPELAVTDLTDAMKFASAVAAMTCTRAGANPPWTGELAQLTSPSERADGG